jgi:hypothetical protein
LLSLALPSETISGRLKAHKTAVAFDGAASPRRLFFGLIAGFALDESFAHDRFSF